MEYGKKKYSSSEAHTKSLKTRRGTYLGLEVHIYVKICEFYLMTQSL
jgi:hypothetical protein